MSQIIVISGAATGFGALAARGLARSGHTVYAGIRNLQADKEHVTRLQDFAADHKVKLKAVEQDVTSDQSVDESIQHVLKEEGRIDTIIHNAGHMSFGPTEAFTPAQLAHLYDINVLGTQRINRAVLPHMRERGKGFLCWIGSSSVHGSTPPFLGPYFAAKAGMDALAASYQLETSQWGIENTLIVPGAFTKGTNHFQSATQPASTSTAAAYLEGPYKGIPEKAHSGLASLEPPTADVAEVAQAVVDVVNTEHGKRPWRVHIDPSQDGAEVVSTVRDRLRKEFLGKIGLEDLLKTRSAP